MGKLSLVKWSKSYPYFLFSAPPPPSFSHCLVYCDSWLMCNPTTTTTLFLSPDLSAVAIHYWCSFLLILIVLYGCLYLAPTFSFSAMPMWAGIHNNVISVLFLLLLSVFNTTDISSCFYPFFCMSRLFLMCFSMII